MFITKKHISRRTVLRGMGGIVALPFLEAMVPVLGFVGRNIGSDLGSGTEMLVAGA